MNFGVTTILILTFMASQVYDCRAATLGDKLVADAHNKKRRLESSSNMKLLAWDAVLAQEAGAYADQCNFAHAPDLTEGENLFATSASYSYSKFQDAVDDWYAEIKDYDLDAMSCNSSKVCGHYTAVVWANTERVGCAAQHCPSGIKEIKDWPGGTIVVCRYAPAGNVQGQNPYEKGTACSACDEGWSECDNDLCSKEAAVTKPPITDPPATEPTNPPVKETDKPPVITKPHEEVDATRPTPPTVRPGNSTARPPNITTTTASTGNSTARPPNITTTTASKGNSTVHPSMTTPSMTEQPSTTAFTGCPTPPSCSSCSEEWRRAMSDWKHHYEIWKTELAQWREKTGKGLE